mgnify:FL=1|tara:strand:+ start:1559 stop:1783 length:225 start_codon:yes stop_codon:yes gene_type:complete
MRNCTKSIHANPIIKKHVTPSSSTYLFHTKKVYTASNLQCPIPTQKKHVAVKMDSYDRRLNRLKAKHLFPNECS